MSNEEEIMVQNEQSRGWNKEVRLVERRVVHKGWWHEHDEEIQRKTRHKGIFYWVETGTTEEGIVVTKTHNLFIRTDGTVLQEVVTETVNQGRRIRESSTYFHKNGLPNLKIEPDPNNPDLYILSYMELVPEGQE